MIVPVRAFVFALTLLPIYAQQSAPFVPLDGVTNSASYAPACAPDGGVAPGSLFAIFGRDIGPPALTQVGSFPLPTTLAGVAVKVAMRGSTYEAWPLFANAIQIGAILPGTVPPGDGALTVTYRGLASESVPIRVRSGAPGLFTLNQRGTGPAVVQNIDAATGAATLNTPAQPLRPGQLATLWGTGLGAVPGAEAAGPLPGDQPNLDVRLWIGDRLTPLIYRGRSGCCAGIDQIVFATPAGIEGCQVPVNIEVSGVTSNFGSVATG